MEKIIDARHLRAYRGDTLVFDDFNLQIDSGEHTAILGPNGAGKSTLLKLISREVHPVIQEGSSLRIFGKERYNVWGLRKRLGIVSHDLQHIYIESSRGIDVVLSGYYSSNDISAHMDFDEEEERNARRIMHRLGIADLADKSFGTMSTGEQRRCLLARALVHAPEALLFDEPTEGLDVNASFYYFETMRRLMNEGVTMILVTHHIHEILPEIERVILLKRGRIEDEGRKEEMLTSEKLSALFDYPLEVLQHNSYYRIVPAHDPSGEPYL